MNFYLIQHEYCGPNPNENMDASTIEIWKSPARTNGSGKIMVEGYCGTTNDWSLRAYGKYDSLEEARAALREEFGECRLDEDAKNESYNDNVIEIYRVGKLIPMNRSETEDWIYDGVRADVTATTTDSEISEIASKYESETAEENGYSLSDTEEIIIAYRDSLRAEEEEKEMDIWDF